MNIQKIISLYIRYENVTSYYVLNVCEYDDLKTIFGLLLSSKGLEQRDFHTTRGQL